MMRKITRVIVFSAALLACNPVFARAQTSGAVPPPSGRELRGQLGASINNTGLQNSLDLSWTWPLTRSDNPLLSGAHIATGVSHALTPAQTRVGGWVEYAPLSIVAVRVGADPSAYFGTFNSLMSFDSYGDSFDKAARDARGGARAGTASRVYIEPSLQLKVGAIVAAASADFERWQSNVAGPYFYEPTRDTLLKSGGDRMVTTNSVVMYQRHLRSGGMVSAGGIHSLAHVYDAPRNRIQRVGLIAIRELSSPHLRLPHPRITGVVTYYVEDPSKQGQVSAALAIGFRTR